MQDIDNHTQECRFPQFIQQDETVLWEGASKKYKGIHFDKRSLHSLIFCVPFSIICMIIFISSIKNHFILGIIIPPFFIYFIFSDTYYRLRKEYYILTNKNVITVTKKRPFVPLSALIVSYDEIESVDFMGAGKIYGSLFYTSKLLDSSKNGNHAHKRYIISVVENPQKAYDIIKNSITNKIEKDE